MLKDSFFAELQCFLLPNVVSTKLGHNQQEPNLVRNLYRDNKRSIFLTSAPNFQRKNRHDKQLGVKLNKNPGRRPVVRRQLFCVLPQRHKKRSCTVNILRLFAIKGDVSFLFAPHERRPKESKEALGISARQSPQNPSELWPSKQTKSWRQWQWYRLAEDAAVAAAFDRKSFRNILRGPRADECINIVRICYKTSIVFGSKIKLNKHETVGYRGWLVRSSSCSCLDARANDAIFREVKIDNFI